MSDEIKDRVLLSKEISKYIQIKQKGKLFWACCPFHNEKTPSFVINNEKKFFYCFGCGEHGDIFAFYNKYLNKNYAEAIEEISGNYNIKISKKNQQNNVILYEILENALLEYQSNLKSNQKAIEYLNERGLKQETIDFFKLGYADESKVIDFLINKGFKIDDIKKTGIVTYAGLDRFRNRIIFPIFSKNNKIIGFSGRVIDNSEPKYINSSETDIFQKNLHLFNQNNLEPRLPVILVEGYMDAISLTQNGIKNVVASMGTALSQGQILMLLRNSDAIYFMLDNDSAGQIATDRNVELCLSLLTPEKQIFVSNLGHNKDPDSLIIKLKNNRISVKNNIESVLKSAKPLLEWKWEQWIVSFDKTPVSLARIFNQVEVFLGKIKNKSVKLAYKTFLDNRIFFMKRNINKSIINMQNTISVEDIILNIIFKLPDFLYDIIEDLMLCNFTNKTYEKIRLDIIDIMTVKQETPEKTIDFIKLKYEKTLESVIKQNHFSYIIYNRGFALQYLRDSIYILRKNDACSLE